MCQNKITCLMYTTSCSGIKGIRSSRGIYPYVHSFAPSRHESHPMRIGDELHVRLRFADGNEMSFFCRRANDMTELVGEVRQAARQKRGLVKMSVNASRGWTLEKPLMLYGEHMPQRSGWGANML